MNDFDYARMIEIPVNSCEVTYKKTPKRFFWKKRPDQLKKQLIDSVNDVDDIASPKENEDTLDSNNNTEYSDTIEVVTVKEDKKQRKKFSLDIITAQIAVIIVLALTIMLTNIFWQDSGINNIVRSVFTSDTNIEKDISYTEFSPIAPTKSADVSLDQGVMTFSGAGSIYSVCDGVVTDVSQVGEKLSMTLQYSPSFSAVISGADYAYYGLGDSVYKSIPVCYTSGDEVKVYLYNNGKLLTNYIIDNGSIVWQS